MTEPFITIQIVVHDGASYIRHCLDAVMAQTYRNIDIVVLDNASADGTADIVAHEYPRARLFRHDKNLGMWPGQEYLLRLTSTEFMCALSVDVILDRDFIARVMDAFRSDDIAAVQGKIYQYDLAAFREQGSAALQRTVLDTCGFGLTRARKVINIGHGEADTLRYAVSADIFGVEGAVPCFRRSALRSCRIDGVIWDPDYFWYGDDFDLAWRMTLFGFRQVYVPDAVAWHDRSTTKGAAAVPVLGQIARRKSRRGIPLRKRRFDWLNVRCTIIKNDFIMNLLRDAPYIIGREAAVAGYTLLFEPAVFAAVPRLFGLLPRMLRRRRLIMERAALTASEMHRFFHT